MMELKVSRAAMTAGGSVTQDPLASVETRRSVTLVSIRCKRRIYLRLWTVTESWSMPNRMLLESQHDLFFEEIERVKDFFVTQAADVEHAHKMIGADLVHLGLNLFRHAVGTAGDQVAAA